MSEKIDNFCETLRIKLTNVENGLQSLHSTIDDKTARAEQKVQDHLHAVKTRIDGDRAHVESAKAAVANWIEQKNATASTKVAEWKAKRELAKLQNRAEAAERYAAAATALAAAALDEAEQAAIEAWLARKDAEIAAA